MKIHSLRTILVFLVTGLCAQAATAQNGEPYLATIAAERIAGIDKPLPATIRARLHFANAKHPAAIFSEVEGVDVVNVSTDTVDVVFSSQATMAGMPGRQHLSHSFVIDFDEPAVSKMTSDIEASYDGTPTIEQLSAHVYSHIEDKTYSRAFDLASQVAASGAGDCTEHAVLLVALARSQGYPARVVLGTLLVDVGPDTRAYGHAWAEIHNGSSWQIADATLPGNSPDVLQVRYLPDGILDNEGPGYALSLMQSATLTPARISEIGPAE